MEGSLRERHRAVNGAHGAAKSQAWKSFAIEEPDANKRNAAEAQLLWELRQALRRRTVHVPSSLSYQSRAAMLNTSRSTVTAVIGMRLTWSEFVETNLFNSSKVAALFEQVI